MCRREGPLQTGWHAGIRSKIVGAVHLVWRRKTDEICSNILDADVSV
jgi:hypothetical protein